jgi:hypothetical protein
MTQWFDGSWCRGVAEDFIVVQFIDGFDIVETQKVGKRRTAC